MVCVVCCCVCQCVVYCVWGGRVWCGWYIVYGMVWGGKENNELDEHYLERTPSLRLLL